MSVISPQPKPYNDEPVMVEGFGALPVVPPKYVAANDNVPLDDLATTTFAPLEQLPERGQYIGLRRNRELA